jgi:hypothetical protein
VALQETQEQMQQQTQLQLLQQSSRSSLCSWLASCFLWRAWLLLLLLALQLQLQTSVQQLQAWHCGSLLLGLLLLRCPLGGSPLPPLAPPPKACCCLLPLPAVQRELAVAPPPPPLLLQPPLCWLWECGRGGLEMGLCQSLLCWTL